jgi:hypothetical protein
MRRPVIRLITQLITLALLVTYFTCTTRHAGAHEPSPALRNAIEAAARAYDLDPAILYRLAECESHSGTQLVGDHGKSIGPFQIHADGLGPLFWQFYVDRSDPYESAMFTAWAIRRRGLASHWTCWRMIQ